MSTATVQTQPTSPNRRGGRGGASNSQLRNTGAGSGGGRRRNNANQRTQRPQNNKPATNPGGGTGLEAKTSSLTLEPGHESAVGSESTSPAVENEVDLCLICTEPIKFYSVAECNHRTCHVCAVRLRALYKKTECTFCKHAQDKVIFTASPDRPFEEYTSDMTPLNDDKLAIAFETGEMMEETLLLLRFNCPDTECTFTGTGWADLKWHVREMHGVFLCDLCIRHKKIFAHEHTLYTARRLMEHIPALRRPPTVPAQHQNRSKDPDKGKEVDGGGGDFFVHPLCAFCRDCFYGSDELYAHLREKHEECFVCKRMGQRDVYFQNYEKLEGHFQAEHYPCNQPVCQERKFVVFPTPIDLQAHQIEEHGVTMGARERKDKMRVEAGFTFDDIRTGRNMRGQQAGGPSSGAGGSSGSGAVPSSNSRRAGFGMTLTRDDEPSFSTQHDGLGYQTDDLTPLQDHLRNLSTSAQFSVISSVRSFRASECSARDMLDTVFGVFDKNLDIMGSVVGKILEVFEEHAEKKTELLAAWNGMKLEERQQFPSLAPVASSSQQAGWAGIASGRVVNLKKATARTSTHQTTRRVWERVEQAATTSASTLPPVNARSVPGAVPRPAATPRPQPPPPPSSSSAFPALSSTVAAPTISAPKKSTTAPSNPNQKTAWAGSSSQAPPPPPSSTPQPFSVNVSSSSSSRKKGPPPPPISSSAFPSLPASSKQGPPKEFVSGKSSANRLKVEAPSSVWGGASAGGQTIQGGSGSGTSTPRVMNEDEGGGGDSATNDTTGQSQGGKKKKKGKEKLFTLGAYPSV